jgi:hypothetical protein
MMQGRKKGKGQTTTSIALMSRKIQVLDYFCAQLYLLADLCLDRNYIAMNLVERQFPYEMLITMMKHPTAQNRVKAPVCRLLRCLYVDRDPQVEEKFPRLIRTSVSLEGGDDADDFKMDRNGTPYAFALLQQIIVEYINGSMDVTKCDELSSEMIDLLLALMRFGFYSNVHELQDIISTLGKTLEDHKNSSKKQLTDGSGSFSESEGGRTINTMESSDNQSTWSAPGKGMWDRLKRMYSSWRDEKTGINRVTPEDQSNAAARDRMFGSSIAPAPHASPEDRKLTSNSNSTSGSDSQRRRTTLKATTSFMTKEAASRRLLAKSWQGKTLMFMESYIYILFVLIAVLTSTSIAIISWIKKDLDVLTGIDVAISAIFFTELTCRMYCNYFVHKEISSFLTNPYKLLDVLVVSADIC